MSKQILRRFGEIRAVEPKKRTAEFVISTADRDRHGTVLNQDNWDLENYLRNPIVGYNHDVYGGFFGTDPDNIIGKTLDIRTENGSLIALAEFEPEGDNELADKIFKKLQFGTLRAASVGFYPVEVDGRDGEWGEDDEAEDGDNPTFYYAGQELLEWSVVNIPSNPNAVKKSAPEDKAKMLRWVLEQITEDVEKLDKLTVKGLLHILDGGDLREILEAENQKRVTERDLWLYKQKNRLANKKYGRAKV